MPDYKNNSTTTLENPSYDTQSGLTPTLLDNSGFAPARWADSGLTPELYYLNNPTIEYVHHSLVPQSVVESNPAEWYYPTSNTVSNTYNSKEIPTFTPDPSWTDQEYVDNRRNYENQLNEIRDSYYREMMNAPDLRYVPVSDGYSPLRVSSPSMWTPGYIPHSPVIVDAQGNRVHITSYFNGGTGGGDEDEQVERITYDTSLDRSGDAFSYNTDYEDRIYGFKHSTVSDLSDWTYDPYKAATHPDYATREGNVASWDRVEGIPTVSRVTPIRDGDRYFTQTTTLPDYSASLERFTHANGNNTTRLPNYTGTATVEDLEASGLLSKPQTIQFLSDRFGELDNGEYGYEREKSLEEGVRTARLQDLFTDRLLVPDQVGRSVHVSRLLSEAIGDARRDAILNTAASNNYNHGSFGNNITSALGTHIFGRAHLAGVDNLSLPITFVDDVLNEGKDINYTGDGLYTYLDDLLPMTRVDPRYLMYRNDGIVRVFTDADYSSWSPGASKISLRESDPQPRNGDLLDRMRTASEAGKFNIGRVIGADYHHNDFPANGHALGDIRNALLHEGIHAATGFNSNVIDSQNLRVKRKLYDDMVALHRKDDSPIADKLLDVRSKVLSDLFKLEEDPASKTTALGAALGVSRDDPNRTSRGYASNSESEMLRALHHAKSGFARHLIADNKLTPEEVVLTVQDPDAFLDFMQGVYRGSASGHNDDPTSYSFPSSMSLVGTEHEMARSIAGIQPFILTLLDTRRLERALSTPLLRESEHITPPKDMHIFKNDNEDPNRTFWKERIYTPLLQLYNFRNHIWSQVRNNNHIGNYQTLA